jgi:hypothetical protein
VLFDYLLIEMFMDDNLPVELLFIVIFNLGFVLIRVKQNLSIKTTSLMIGEILKLPFLFCRKLV